MTVDDHHEICTFCAEISGAKEFNLFYELGVAEERSDYVLVETPNFIVIPCIGALTDWYVLVVSKRHVLSVGWLTEDEREELKVLLSQLSEVPQAEGSQGLAMFEHGTLNFRDKGGACYDHCHIHVVATESAVQEFLASIPAEFDMNPVPSWIDGAYRMIQEDQRSYLAASSRSGEMIGSAAGAPSQFFRRALATWLGQPAGEWDAMLYPQKTRVKLMMEMKPLLSGDAKSSGN